MDPNIPPEIANAIHGINAQAFNLNKNIVQKTQGMQDIPLSKEIYGSPPPAQPPGPQVVPPPHVVQVAPQQGNIDPALLNNLIERVTAVERQITKFVNLIERRVAKDAKEINIRIKLDDDSTNKE